MCIIHDNETLEVSRTRLPKDVVPKHYTLAFTPDLVAFTFTGEETIDVQVLKNVSSITINSAEIKISGITITDKFGNSRPGQVSYDAENEFATFTFAGEVVKGRHQLAFSFEGEINDKLHGFYRSIYKDANGKEHVIASTQMEPADARRAFPCFDEPEFKATYGITLVVDEHLTALSNGRQLSVTSLPGGKKSVRFKRTIKMATYIVAFVVGEVVPSKTVIANGVKIRIFHVPGKEHLVQFALDAAVYAIKECEKYFGIKYPGDKLDLIAIPEFAFGAMENLGCMIFRETALLINPLTATVAELMRVFEVVAHEIVHSWFGDLVTMIWWHGLWLNEAFATFVSMKIVNKAHPEWNMWESFAAARRGGAMRTDGLQATRPIQAPVVRAQDSLGMVDGITYGKGAGVLWQLEQYIGENTFRDGIRVYLNTHAYGNTENSDLWDAIGGETDIPVRRMMDSWIFQPGHPVVSVSDISATGASAGRVTLNQKRFLYGELSQDNKPLVACALPESGDAPTLVGEWLIPVNLRYQTAKGLKTRWVLLDKREKSIYLGKNVKWVIANSGGVGFYRTRYASSITSKIEVSKLSTLERFNLVNDAWACVRAGLVTSDDYFEVISEFSNETDSNVMGVIIGSLGTLKDVLPKANRPAFRAFIRELLTPALTRLGWEDRAGDDAQDKQLRGQVISTLGCTGRDPAVQAKAKELFKKYLADQSSVSSNVAPALVWIAADGGDEAQYEQFKSLYEATANPQDRVRYLYALGGFRDKNLLRKTLAATITKVVRTQDAPALLSSILATDIKVEAWKFVQDNWEFMVKHFAETGLISLVGGFASLNTPSLEAEVQAFVAAHPVRGGSKQVAQLLENLRLSVAFGERERDRMVARFAVTLKEGSTEVDLDGEE